jgi:hypothetical protein
MAIFQQQRPLTEAPIVRLQLGAAARRPEITSDASIVIRDYSAFRPRSPMATEHMTHRLFLAADRGFPASIGTWDNSR